LLCASSRHRAVREQEKQRPPTGLVKVVCLPFDVCTLQQSHHGKSPAAGPHGNGSMSAKLLTIEREGFPIYYGHTQYEILLVCLWTVAYRYRDDGDCMVYSLFDLLRCMDDIFIASFGGFCDFIVSEAFWWISARLCMTGWFGRYWRWPVHVFGVWFPLQVFKMICCKSWVYSCMDACYLSRTSSGTELPT